MKYSQKFGIMVPPDPTRRMGCVVIDELPRAVRERDYAERLCVQLIGRVSLARPIQAVRQPRSPLARSAERIRSGSAKARTTAIRRRPDRRACVRRSRGL